jgi:hypothetical protein
MHVVDHEQQRPPAREVRAHPVQSVHDRERCVRARLPVTATQTQNRCCESSRAVEHRVAIIACKLSQRPFEELPDDAIGELTLELPAAGGETVQAARGGHRAGRGEQARLADAGRTHNGDRGAATLGRGSHELAELTELSLAFEQRRPGRLRG